MNSANLVNFSPWKPFNSVQTGLAPESKGVYVIRTVEGIKFGRLVGESDILYIGCTEESVGGLRRRLKGYVSPGRTQWTNIRVKNITSKHPAEIAWLVIDSPKQLECTLLKKCLADHDELPPLNNSEERTLESDLQGSFTIRNNADGDEKITWWVYENWRASTGGKAIVHNGNCSFCREGKGVQSQDSGRNGEWHGPFETRQEAYECAMRCHRAKTDFCSFCAEDKK